MANFKTIFQHFAKEKELSADPLQDQAVELLNQRFVDLQKPIKKSWLGKSKKSTVKGLYLWGGVGRGKTMMMDLFYQSLPFDDKRRVHFNIFMLDVHNTLKMMQDEGRGRDPLPQIAKDIAKNVRLLCFDEFQVYDIADAMVLADLFQCLFVEGVTVIATSNVAPDDLYKGGLQRARFLPFIGVVKQYMDVLHLDSPTDYRQQALRDGGTYFIHAEGKMQSLFDKLTFPHQPKPDVIKVNGRDLPMVKAANDCAWVSFSELCEKPRAAADYQALATCYKTVFLNQVPRMGYDRRNEAKRFILLIDTLYDANTRLILNAEVEPQKLYHGKDHAFEFERTISRLLEMQGEGYLLKTARTDQ